jgi:hypothetical protein
LLRRIPAVKWAFTRLRPLPHSGSIAVVPFAADPSAVIAEGAPAPDTSAAPLHDDADVAVTAAVTENDTAVSVIAESPTAAPSDINFTDGSSDGAPTEIGPIEAEATLVSPAEAESEPVEVPDVVISDDLSPSVSAEVEPVVRDEASVVRVDAEVSGADIPEVSTDSDPSPGIAIEIAPLPANNPPVAAEPACIAPEPVPASPAPEIASPPKARAKVIEPVDRATLIRQRWTETGIRMWNPRLHGTGDATLNIQGRVELLPPEPGETMPRYDKLEFRMLGGQIVCEGVIVEAPAHASQRSFTRLAEPGKADRVREPVRERQAALA